MKVYIIEREELIEEELSCVSVEENIYYSREKANQHILKIREKLWANDRIVISNEHYCKDNNYSVSYDKYHGDATCTHEDVTYRIHERTLED